MVMQGTANDGSLPYHESVLPAAHRPSEEQALQTSGDSTISSLTGESYKLAKIEHYLRQAEECFQMCRYSASMKVLDTVCGLEPANASAASLKKRIWFQVSALEGRPTPPEGNGAIQPKGRRNRKGVILLADQDERILMRLSETLRKYGFDVVSAVNYVDALETMKYIVPDVVVSEVNFESGPAGFDLFLWLRSSAPTQTIPFVFLATRIDREVLIAGKRLGVDDFLVKPVDEAVVAASILNCLTRARKSHKSVAA